MISMRRAGPVRRCVSAACLLLMPVACSGGGAASARPLAEGVHYTSVLSTIDGRAYSPRGVASGGVQLDLDNPAPGPPLTGLQQILPFRAALLWSACGTTNWKWTFVESRMSFADQTDVASIERCEPAWRDAFDQARAVLASAPTMRFDGTTMAFAGNGHTVVFTVVGTGGPGATTTTR